MRYLLLCLLCLFPSLADAQTVWWGDGPGGQRDGWYTHPPCNNDGTNGKPMCKMCWGPNGIAARQERVNQLSAQAMQNVRYVSQPTSVSSDMEAYTVQVPVTKQVKRCKAVGLFGRQTQCYYETVTVMETQTRYRPRVAAKVARLEARAANAMRRVAYTVKVPVTKRVCIGKDNQGRCIFGNVTTYETKTEYRMEPVEPQATNHIPDVSKMVSKEAAQSPTPYEAVAAMIRLINPDENEVLYDLGSGDGRVLIAGAVAGAKTVGIELDPKMVKESKEMLEVFGVSDRVKVYQGDILTYNLNQCQLVTMYLYPELMEQVVEKLPSGCKVWTYLHGLPGAKKHEVDGYTFYEWIKA
jgi:hypothetical protein